MNLIYGTIINQELKMKLSFSPYASPWQFDTCLEVKEMKWRIPFKDEVERVKEINLMEVSNLIIQDFIFIFLAFKTELADW